MIKFLMKKNIPTTLTSYDLLKTFAILTMIVDHIGANFYPDDMWWRVVGRMSAPIWLFLVGYAKSRDLSPTLWAGVAILAAANFVVGQAILPLCILATIIICRIGLNPAMDHVKLNPKSLYPIVFVIFILSIPTSILFDYGVGVFLFAMMGYFYRQRDNFTFLNRDYFVFALIVGFSHALLQVEFFFPFNDAQKIIAGLLILTVTLGLTLFKPLEYRNFDKRLPAFISGFFKICGRKSLEIFVIHLVVFKMTALILGIEGFALFDFHIF